MTTDERGLCLNGPVTLGGVKIGVADTSADKLDKTFTGGELRSLLHGEVILDLELSTSGVDDSCLLDFGDGGHFKQKSRRESCFVVGGVSASWCESLMDPPWFRRLLFICF